MRYNIVDSKLSTLNQFACYDALLKILETISRLKMELSVNGDVGVPYTVDFFIKHPSRVNSASFLEVTVGELESFKWLAIVSYLLNYDLFESGNARWCDGDELSAPLIGEIKRWWGKKININPSEIQITSEVIELYCKEHDLNGAEEIFKQNIDV